MMQAKSLPRALWMLGLALSLVLVMCACLSGASKAWADEAAPAQDAGDAIVASDSDGAPEAPVAGKAAVLDDDVEGTLDNPAEPADAPGAAEGDQPAAEPVDGDGDQPAEPGEAVGGDAEGDGEEAEGDVVSPTPQVGEKPAVQPEGEGEGEAEPAVADQPTPAQSAEPADPVQAEEPAPSQAEPAQPAEPAAAEQQTATPAPEPAKEATATPAAKPAAATQAAAKAEPAKTQAAKPAKAEAAKTETAKVDSTASSSKSAATTAKATTDKKTTTKATASSSTPLKASSSETAQLSSLPSTSKYAIIHKRDGKLYIDLANSKGQATGAVWVRHDEYHYRGERVFQDVQKLFIASNVEDLSAPLYWMYQDAEGKEAIATSQTDAHGIIVDEAREPNIDGKLHPETLEFLLDSKGTSHVSVLREEFMSGTTHLRRVINFEKTRVSYINEAFSGCPNLESIKLPSTLTGTFDGCRGTSLKKLVGLENTQITTMGENYLLFGGGISLGLSKLEELRLPETCTHICSQAFDSCEALKTVYFNSAIERIDSGAFRGCSSLVNLNGFEKVNVKVLYPIFQGCTSLRSVNTPKGLEELYTNAFKNCDFLESITFGSNLKVVGDNAFENAAGIKSITLPASLESIGSNAFKGCTNLKTIYLATNAVVDAGSNILQDTPMAELAVNGAWIYVPKGKLSAYTSTASDNKWLSYRVHFKGYTPSVKHAVISVKDVTYNGKAQKPAVTVTYGTQKLVAGKDYTVTYKNNTNAGTATVTVKGKGNFGGTVTKSFKIKSLALKGASVTVASATYTGKKLTPAVTVKLGGKTLKKGTDYKVTYKNNVNAGTATATITGIGGYKGTLSKSFTIQPAWKRLYGQTALDTMSAIVNAGFAKSNYVILATDAGYWDALSASGLAGIYKCPIVLTSPKTLSAQAKKEIKRLGAKNVIIVGGKAVVSTGIENTLKKSMKLNVKRLWGQTMIDTANAIYNAGKGKWATTAILATPDGYYDALSISPYAYAKKAPVLLVNSGSHVMSAATSKNVKTGGFKRVVITGGKFAVASSVDSAVKKMGKTVVRLAGNTAYDTSYLVANWCVKQGLTANNVGVATGKGYWDALSASTFCGKLCSALVLVNDDDYTTINKFVKARKAAINRGWVFGGPGAVNAATYGALIAATRR